MSEYNGWSNFETWQMALRINNDGMNMYWRDLAAELYTRAEDTADAIKTFYQNDLEECDLPAWMMDAVSAFLNRVDWVEIAKSITGDLA